MEKQKSVEAFKAFTESCRSKKGHLYSRVVLIQSQSLSCPTAAEERNVITHLTQELQQEHFLLTCEWSQLCFPETGS